MSASRRTIFAEDADYDDFEDLIQESLEHATLPISTYILMPNHWHFVVRPNSKEELSEFFQYLAGTHATRFRYSTCSRGEGHVYQDRFKCFPVENDGHFSCVCRYVERNALRANLVRRAEDWRWSGLSHRLRGTDGHLHSNWPVPRPPDWLERVNEALTHGELAAIRNCVRRGRPLGKPDWVKRTAKQLGLEFTLRSPGRPRLTSASAREFA